MDIDKDKRIKELEETVKTLLDRIAELERKLNTSSKNSSMPPSSDKPGNKQARPKKAEERKNVARRKGISRNSRNFCRKIKLPNAMYWSQRSARIAAENAFSIPAMETFVTSLSICHPSQSRSSNTCAPSESAPVANAKFTLLFRTTRRNIPSEREWLRWWESSPAFSIPANAKP